VAADLLDQHPGVAPGERVELGRELVEHRDPGATDQRERDQVVQPVALSHGIKPEHLDSPGARSPQPTDALHGLDRDHARLSAF
jgi:hypothetical protein